MTAQDGGLFTSCPGRQEAALDTWGLMLAPTNLHCGLGAKGDSSTGPVWKPVQKLGEEVEEANP